MFEAVHKIVFIASYSVLVGLFPLVMHWKIYRIYKIAGERVRSHGFFWFSIYVQMPGLRSSQRAIEALPEDVRLLVASVRDWRRRFVLGFVVWIIFLIALGSLMMRLSNGQ